MMELPESIFRILKDREFEINTVGLSDSQVICFDDAVLKIEAAWEETETASVMLRWIQGRIPAPRILAEESKSGINYLLMSRLPGKMSCDEEYMRDPRRLVKMLAKALDMLWAVDISDCPVDQGLGRKLRQAEYRVRNGLVDLEKVEPGTFGEGGFRDPEDLLRWLRENCPEERAVLSHGDFCLPNIFFMGEEIAGYIDLGRCGVADPYQDIALCYRSLCHNFEGRYGRAYPGFDPAMFFEALGIEPDWEKIRYYTLMDELF